MIGATIIDLRKNKNLSQAELAQALGISRSALSLYEINKREPDYNILCNIAKYFGVSTDYLLGLEDTAQSIPQSSDPDESLAKFMSDYDRLNDNGKAYIKDQMGYALSKEIFTEKDTDERKKA